MSSERHDKVHGLILEETAKFLSHESNRSSLITVTSVVLSDNMQRATIGITVLPESDEEKALGFVMRQATHLREHLKKKTRLGRIPYLHFVIDDGEKNRQRIDKISRDTKEE